MLAQIDRKAIRRRIRYRVRKKISGTATRPRLAVFRSQRYIEVQAIDDEQGRTLAHTSSRDGKLRGASGKSWNTEAASKVGQAMAERLKSAGIETVVFDRGGFVYRGRVKALAEAMREGGLKL